MRKIFSNFVGFSESPNFNICVVKFPRKVLKCANIIKRKSLHFVNRHSAKPPKIKKKCKFQKYSPKFIFLIEKRENLNGSRL